MGRIDFRPGISLETCRRYKTIPREAKPQVVFQHGTPYLWLVDQKGFPIMGAVHGSPVSYRGEILSLSEISISQRVDEKTGIRKPIILADVYVGRPSVEEQINKFIEDRIEKPQDTMWFSIEGDAGLGKTCLLRKLAETYLLDSRISSRFLHAEEEDSLIKLDNIAREAKAIPERTVVFIDTLDYLIAKGEAQKLNEAIRELSKSGAMVITTSRVQEMKQYMRVPSPVLGESLMLSGFAPAEINSAFEKYIKAYYPKQPDARTKEKAEELMQNHFLLDLCANPLHLRMLFDVYSPHEIDAKTEIDVQDLYRKYWEEKVSSSRMYPKSEDSVSVRKELIVMELAFEMLKNGAITDIRKHKEMSLRAEKEALEDLKSEGVLAIRGEALEFFHQTFFEYAAARAILFDGKNPNWQIERRVMTLLTSGGLFILPVLEQIALQAGSFGKTEIKDLILPFLANAEDITYNLAAIRIYFKLDFLSKNEERIIKELIERDYVIKCKMAEIAGKITGRRVDRTIEILKSLTQDEHPSARVSAAKGLGEIGQIRPEESLPVLSKLAEDKDARVRIRVAIELGRMGQIRPEEVLPVLLKLAEDTDSWVRYSAAGCLSELRRARPEESLPVLSKLAEDKNSEVRAIIAKALSRIGKINLDKSLPILANLAEDADFYARDFAVEGIIKISRTHLEATLPLLRKLLTKSIAGYSFEVKKQLLDMAEVIRSTGIKEAKRIELGNWGARGI